MKLRLWMFFAFGVSAWGQPDWQIHARWCTTDPGSSGQVYRAGIAAGAEPFDAVLACQRHNGGAQQAVSAAGRAAVNNFMGYAPPPPPPPDWQIHAKWCTTDPGTYGGGGRDYRNWRSGGNDQYDSVLACQEHDGRAQQSVREAGREAINTFLGSAFAPPPRDLTKPEWQIHATWCVKDPAPWGGGGRDYRNWRSGGNDQYDSVLACQEHNSAAKALISQAGRAAVNAFLGSTYAPQPPSRYPTNPTADQAVCVYNVGNLRTALFDDIHAPYVMDGKANHDLIGKTVTFTSGGTRCDQRNMPGTPTSTVTMKITAIQAEEQLVFDRHRYMIVTGTAI